MKGYDNKVNEYLVANLSRIISKEKIFTDEPMSLHTTFRVGGAATCYVVPETEEEVVKVVQFLQKADIPHFLIGNGSNLLVSDKGYKGVILQMGPKMERIEVLGNVMRVSAGTTMAKVAKVAAEHSLTGLEFASGIPGTVGGGVVMNAGAYDGEMSFVVRTVKVINPEGEILELENETMEFAYRHTALSHRNFIVLSVEFELKAGNQQEIIDKMNDFSNRRREKQPLEYPSAGSTFKRPEGHFAGKLIQDAGLRGFSIGGACISEKHCGFVINKDHATASDIMAVIKEVQKRVDETFHVALETEVIALGDFS